MAPIVFNNNRPDQLSKFEKLKIWRLMKFMTAKTGSKTHDFASVAANSSSASTTVTVTGAKVGDEAFAKINAALPSGVYLIASITAADTATVTLRNNSSAAVDLASATLTVRAEDRTKNNH